MLDQQAASRLEYLAALRRSLSNFTLQTIPEQDRLRERIWKALVLKMEEMWLVICLTGEAHWA